MRRAKRYFLRRSTRCWGRATARFPCGVARQCGIAVGTIYNYFESKDMLIACIMVEDWKRPWDTVPAGAAARTAGEGLAAMHGAIRQFASIYEGVWSQFFSAGGSPGVVAGRHGMCCAGSLPRESRRLPRGLAAGRKACSLLRLRRRLCWRPPCRRTSPPRISFYWQTARSAGKGEEIQQK